MSQPQPRRPQDYVEQEPIKYGDVFSVTGDLAEKPIAPQDAAVMQTAETTMFGEVQRGGPAAVMQSAAAVNERAGLVRPRDAAAVTGDREMNVTATDYQGTRVITESVSGQVVGQYYDATPLQQGTAPATALQSQITMGEALEAAASVVGDKPVNQSDAAALRAAEARATGINIITPGGVAAAAQSAASYNTAVDSDEDKVKLADVLKDATAKLPGNKVVTREDARAVSSAERRSNPNLTTYPGGVAESVATAARFNEQAKATAM
ncbi:late embryogenesis abundant protein D-34-like [Diospyros lotus]|uniref:late embryogenesis abundant protein D-34-like n=1 Tax=Diospyros lotus TaxID=55363 RepID=UPI00224F5353|nr:late embryogenesis abundant protein D-34-like [Diospyros lotus]XP_052208420.1 late embryogenesis abundant protein D-34-like [Diospyros lotus]